MIRRRPDLEVKRRISKHAPAWFSLIFGALAAAAFAISPPPWPIVLLTIGLGVILVALSVIDVRTMRLPDSLTLPLIPCGAALPFLLSWDAPHLHLAAAAAGFLLLFLLALLYEALRGRAGLGLGDAKLYGAAGAWLGPAGLPPVMLWACALALAVVAVWSLATGRSAERTRIPFGPFLALGFWIVWLYGAPV